MNKELNNLMQKGKEFLGVEIAILAGAMSWVSESNLVAAVSNAGGFGVIAAGSMPAELLDKEIKKTKEKTAKPFGVNLIVMHPDLENLAKVCIDNNVSHVVLAGGLPPKNIITMLKSNDIKIMSFAPALAIAKKLIRSGVDALVIEGMEAGGHIGPVSTSVLVQEILPEIKDEIPVFVAGGIGRGEQMLAYLRQGAAGIQIGTRLVCAKECIAHENFKKAFIKASARQATASVQIDPDFPVIPVRAIENKATIDFTKAQIDTIAEFRSGKIDKQEAQLKIEHFWAGALRKAVIDGDVENGSLMAGQSVGMVKEEQTVKEIFDELILQAK